MWWIFLPLLLIISAKPAPKKELLVFRFKYIMYYAYGLCYTRYQVTDVLKGKNYQRLIGKDMFMTFAHDSMKKYKQRHELKCIRCWQYNCTGYLSQNKKKEYSFHTIKIQAFPVDHAEIKKAMLRKGKPKKP